MTHLGLQYTTFTQDDFIDAKTEVYLILTHIETKIKLVLLIEQKKFGLFIKNAEDVDKQFLNYFSGDQNRVQGVYLDIFSDYKKIYNVIFSN